MQRFEETGSLMNLPHTGRPRSARKEENIERVRASIEDEPQTFTRRRSRELGLSRTSLRRILTKDLKMFPYKIQLVQKLKPTDHPQRLNYAIRIQELARENNEFIHELIMSDEAHFHLNGFVNKQNCRFWST
jgi:hypothetical protein